MASGVAHQHPPRQAGVLQHRTVRPALGSGYDRVRGYAGVSTGNGYGDSDGWKSRGGVSVGVCGSVSNYRLQILLQLGHCRRQLEGERRRLTQVFVVWRLTEEIEEERGISELHL